LPSLRCNSARLFMATMMSGWERGRRPLAGHRQIDR
jgi:hypothetical protein